MTGDLQNLMALAVVALAAWYIVRRGWTMLQRRTPAGCGSCGGCPEASHGPAGPLVTREELLKGSSMPDPPRDPSR